jgi:AcrR family transcriptional regulator
MPMVLPAAPPLPSVRTVDSDRLDGIVRAMDRGKAGMLRDRMLDAAEAVVVRQGIANLTLEAVAAEAGMSKGGLLHHFPSKDKLIEGLVSRCAENWRVCSLEAFERTPEGPGRMARALLSHLGDAQSWTDQCQRSSSAVFAALAQNPALIQPMRNVYGDLRRRLANDGLPPGVGETVVAAMDGLWLYRVLGLAAVDQDLMDLIRRVLEPLVALRPLGERGRSAASRPIRGRSRAAKMRKRGGSR